jgi:hypothetical protein
VLAGLIGRGLVMPIIALMHMLIGVAFAYHAVKTGRAQYWLYILLFMPLVGPLAYVLIELVPELGSTRRARRVASGIGDIINPDREWKRRHEDALRTDSVDTKRALAEECERKGMWLDAITLYQKAAQGVFADDPALLYGLARAQLGSGDGKAAEETLDRLRAAHPDMTHQEAHLLYARALEVQSRLQEAADEYEALSGYYAGLEARTRYGLLLLKLGEPSRAHTLFQDVVRAGTARQFTLLEADRGWLKVARANL